MIYLRLIAAALALAIAPAVAGFAPALAHDYSVGALKIDHPYARATPPMARAGGGYLTIANTGDADDALITGEADFAERVEIHDHIMVDGAMRMVELEEGVTIPAGESVTLEPGGVHVMFIGLTEQLVAGEQRAVTLNFAEAGDVEVIFSVETIRPMHNGHSMH